MSWAIYAHKKQKQGDVHYAVHCFQVYATLVDHRVLDEYVLAAALLHDVMEDCAVPFDEIQYEFGDKVAKYVAEVTDDIRLPRAEQLRQQIKKIETNSIHSVCIKIADRICNLRRNPGQRAPSEKRLDHSRAIYTEAMKRTESLSAAPVRKQMRLLLQTLKETIASYEFADRLL